MTLDLDRSFLPESLAEPSTIEVLGDEDRRRLNQVRAASYLHVFDVLETCLSDAVRAQAMRDPDARDALVPLLRLDAFDHNELFRTFERSFAATFVVAPKLAPRPRDLDEVLGAAAPLSLLVVALHLKLVTQQHYLACVRGDESLEPHFVKVLKDHWAAECGVGQTPRSTVAIERALGAALPGRVPAGLRDYRRIVFTCDDVLRRQSELDVDTLEAARDKALPPAEREAVLAAELASHRKAFITVGIVNTAFVYAMRSLGPAASEALAAVVSTLAAR